MLIFPAFYRNIDTASLDKEVTSNSLVTTLKDALLGTLLATVV